MKYRTGGCVRKSAVLRSEEHTSELQSRSDLVCRLLLEKKKNKIQTFTIQLSPSTPQHAERAVLQLGVITSKPRVSVHHAQPRPLPSPRELPNQRHQQPHPHDP